MRQKYKDKGTTLGYQKQIDKLDNQRSCRSIRREKERNLQYFSEKICKYVSKEWWSSFSVDERMEMYINWSGSKFRYGYKVEFEVWLEEAKLRWKPDSATYREKIIDRLLDDN